MHFFIKNIERMPENWSLMSVNSEVDAHFNINLSPFRILAFFFYKANLSQNNYLKRTNTVCTTNREGEKKEKNTLEKYAKHTERHFFKAKIITKPNKTPQTKLPN